jgi:APA family basic amino acid/polyamine antiporter
MSAFTGAATLTLWAFIGLESAVVPADEVTNSRVITKATMIGTFATALLYILLTIALLGLIPANILKNSASPLSDAAVMLFGHHADLWIAGFAIITIMGALNGSILVQVQDAMAAADHQLFPRAFSKRSRFDTPAKGFVISALVMTGLLLLTLHDSLLKQFNFLLLLSTLSFLIPYFVSATAELMILSKTKAIESFKMRLVRNLIALAASIYAFWMFIGAGTEIIVYGCLFFFALFWVYWLFCSRRIS